jgi:two-component system phosphate regulon response regulator PhoB
MQSMEQKRIILVEDEKDMADLVAMQLERENYEVETAYDGEEGLQQILDNPPDLVLLDLMLPSLSGTEIITRIRGDSDATVSRVPVIMLTAKSEENDIVVGLRLGADDYVTKPFSMPVLLARVDAILRRADQPDGDEAEILKSGPITVDLGRHQVAVNEQEITLTTTEFGILTSLMSARGRVLTRYQLIDKVMGIDAVVTDRTIDVHLTSLRRKLGEARGLIKTVRGVGYRLLEYDEETA